MISAPLRRREKYQDSSSQVFPAAAGGRLTVAADLGSVEVRAYGGDVIEVEVFREVEAEDRAEATGLLKDLRVEFTPYEGGLAVRAERLSRLARVELRLRFKVPQSCAVDLQTGAGGISVIGTRGAARAKTAAGSLHFEDVAGDVSADTRAGGITVLNVSGGVRAHTSAGSVRIEQDGTGEPPHGGEGGGAAGPSAVVEAVSGGGGLRARVASQPAGPWHLATSAGKIEVEVGDGVALDVDARTKAGKVVSEIPVLVSGEIGGGSLRASVNGGGPAMVLRTSAGDIRLRKI